jgi:hypothetical protein
MGLLDKDFISSFVVASGGRNACTPFAVGS